MTCRRARAVCMLSVTGMEARILNPRKLLIRAVLSVHVECYERRELETVCGVDCGGEGEQVESLVETCSVSPVVAVKEKTFTLTDEYRFDGLPPAGELLWHSVEHRAGLRAECGQQAGVRRHGAACLCCTRRRTRVSSAPRRLRRSFPRCWRRTAS